MHLSTATFRASKNIHSALPVVEDFVRSLSDSELSLWLDPKIPNDVKPVYPGQLRFLTDKECLFVISMLGQFPNRHRLYTHACRTDEEMLGAVIAQAQHFETLQAAADSIYVKVIVKLLKRMGYERRAIQIETIRAVSPRCDLEYDTMPAYSLRFGTPFI